MGAVMRMAHFIQHTILRGLNGIFSANADVGLTVAFLFFVNVFSESLIISILAAII